MKLPPESSFRCAECRRWLPYEEMNLDANNRAVCNRCYLANPPREDVDGVFAEVMGHVCSELRGSFSEEAKRQHARAVEGVCGACGGTTYNGRCTNACR